MVDRRRNKLPNLSSRNFIVNHVHMWQMPFSGYPVDTFHVDIQISITIQSPEPRNICDLTRFWWCVLSHRWAFLVLAPIRSKLNFPLSLSLCSCLRYYIIYIQHIQDMFGYALRHPKLPARNGIANNAGLTPLTLACQLGRAEVFREMLELSAREFWRYSNITCSAYPLNALDTLLPDGRTSTYSIL